MSISLREPEGSSPVPLLNTHGVYLPCPQMFQSGGVTPGTLFLWHGESQQVLLRLGVGFNLLWTILYAIYVFILWRWRVLI